MSLAWGGLIKIEHGKFYFSCTEMLASRSYESCSKEELFLGLFFPNLLTLCLCGGTLDSKYPELL